jgi:SOS-response transcriptional repressor LexA
MGTSAVLATAANLDPQACFLRVVGNSMEPVLGNGWLVRADTTRLHPHPGEVVAVEVTGEGIFVGYWCSGDTPVLLKENPGVQPLDLAGKTWRIVGVVTTIVDRPIESLHRPA